MGVEALECLIFCSEAALDGDSVIPTFDENGLVLDEQFSKGLGSPVLTDDCRELENVFPAYAVFISS